MSDAVIAGAEVLNKIRELKFARVCHSGLSPSKVYLCHGDILLLKEYLDEMSFMKHHNEFLPMVMIDGLRVIEANDSAITVV
jgi:hypothetical protein